MTRLLMSLYIALVPLMRVPDLPLVHQKIQYSELVFLPLAFTALAGWVTGTIRLRERAALLAPAIALIAALCVTLLLRTPHLRDVIELAGIAYLVALFTIVLCVAHEDDWSHYLRVWAWTSTAVCLLGVVGYGIAAITGQPNTLVPILNPSAKLALFPASVRFDLRVCSTFRNPNMLASYLIASTAFILVLMKDRTITTRATRVYGAMLCLHVVTAALTKSRTAAGVFLLATVGAFLLWPARKYIALKLSAALLTAAYCVLALVTVVVWVFPVQKQSPWINTKYTEYFLQSEAGYRMWKDHPSFGIGLGRYNENLPRYFDWEEAKRSLPEMPSLQVKDPHSTYFGWAAEAGAMGLLGILLVLVVHFGAVIRRHAVFATGIVAFALAGFSMDILTLRHFWFLLGMSGAYVYRVSGSSG